MTNGSDGAFAKAAPDFMGGVQLYGGLTKREYFAAMAMQGILSHKNTPGDATFDEIAARAVPMADALITALNQEQK